MAHCTQQHVCFVIVRIRCIERSQNNRAAVLLTPVVCMQLENGLQLIVGAHLNDGLTIAGGAGK
jgi:hypothetical protein